MTFSLGDTIDYAIDQYLSTNLDPIAGKLLHWSAMISSGFMTGYKKKGRSLVDSIVIVNLSSISRTVSSYMNEIWDCLRDPNIEGIPIASPNIRVTRESDVSKNPMLYAEGFTRMNLVDSSAPHPREWAIEGYLTSQSFTDSGFTVKPSLIMQAKLLDAFQKSRRPLWFKTPDMEFVTVLISHLEIEDTAAASNVKKVTMTLVEWVVIELESSPNKSVTCAEVNYVTI